MKIIYQGTETETAAPDLIGLLREKGVEGQKFLIEFNDDVLSSDSEALAGIRINAGDRINLFRIVPGG